MAEHNHPSRSSPGSTGDTILAPVDPLRGAIWLIGFGLAGVAALLRPGWLATVAAATAQPFLTLAAIVAAGLVAERVGVFRAVARVLICPRLGPGGSAAAVLAFTALVSGMVNLDVAVVVAVPVALRVARRHGLGAGRLAAAAALTANATSFLLPTSNVTSLLLLSRSPLPLPTYLRESWVAWLLVTSLTVGALTLTTGRGRAGATADPGEPGVSTLSMLIDLVPMFAATSAIRALLGTGLVLTGGFVQEVVTGALLAAGVNNLAAAAAVQPVGATGFWAGVLAMALGPNLLLTGSVASLICRRIAHDGQAAFGAVAFTALGTALLPAQLLLAWAGLMLTGAVG